jgi:hypothetical protein
VQHLAAMIVSHDNYGISSLEIERRIFSTGFDSTVSELSGLIWIIYLHLINDVSKRNRGPSLAHEAGLPLDD